MLTPIEKFSSSNRVLVLVKTGAIKDDKLPRKKDVLALILIRDKVRKEAQITLNYFKENDVNIKVISGDKYKK